VIGKLTRHPDAAANKAALRQAEAQVAQTLETMEKLKPRINKKYERYQKLTKDRAAMGIPPSRKMSTPSATDTAAQKRERIYMDPATAGAETLGAAENSELAVKLAHREIKRRAIARKATRRAGITEDEEHERRTAGVWGNWEHEFASDHTGVDGDSLSRQMQDVRLQVDNKQQRASTAAESRPHLQPSGSYKYPTIPAKSQQNGYRPTPIRPPRPEKGLVESLTTPPPPPPKDDVHSKLPPRPAKQPIAELEANSPTLRSPMSSTSTSTSEAELSSSSFTFQPAAYLESGAPLRTVFLPPDLRHRFLDVAARNTRNNLETCGILCGTLISNALFVSKLLIPEQKSTSDTCETTDENMIFEYVDSEDLMVLGWIHTHPSQSCFMSSRDLHTHSGYQVMIPESIAIVCAPSKNEWGVFRLTDPPGLKSILNCRQPGLFHPHDQKHIYTEALRPGHVCEAKGMEFDVHDMRSSK
jgi:STAM-binding protein